MAQYIPNFKPKDLLKSSFWLEEYKMHEYLKPVHGASPTKADIALTWGIGTLFMLMPLAFYDSDSLPAEGWQRGLFCLINLYLAGSAITHWTEDTVAWWAGKNKNFRQTFLVLNGISLGLVIVAMPGAMAPCFVAFALATATALFTGMVPKKLIKPVAMSGAVISMVVTMGFGATSAAAPTCIMYIIFICLAFTVSPPGMAASLPQM
ncbi:hypothetical protein KFE25_008091 [Diacronema lutheri]|uniref:Uncharacterized protein n=1 Tax=Diacronema lutheri TaxID=2081491 RepID=A0A8J5XQT8_DIALT|nr:hypothetical protein KFE25_008091 [Diacronema lutheri]